MARAHINRLCSECGESLDTSNPKAKTCGVKCRGRRSRRLKRQSEEQARLRALPPERQALAKAVEREAPDVAHAALKEALGPVVREALTEDVLRAISDLVGLTPRAVELMQADLESTDPVLRQRAYTLLLKYTVGHPAVVQPQDADPNQQLVVHFNLPRPTEGAQGPAPEPIVEVQELRTCVVCAEEKDSSQFVANSDRCEACHTKMQAKVEELLGNAS